MLNRRVLALLAGIVVLAATAGAAGESREPAPLNSTWRSECGACHLAYPPRLLPARSWHALMSGLDKHFGTDASLDPAVTAEISAFLERHAGRDRNVPTSLRITDTPWFQRKHRKISGTVWARPAIKSPTNCSACHAGAERGDFDDDTVRIPR
jgi:hypothetical protein